MPRGGTGHFLTKQDLRDRIKEIEDRIKQMDRRDRALSELKAFLAKRHLGPLDLLWMYRQMQPKRADKPVKSKRPLQPLSNQQKHKMGVITKDGRPVERKGDPEFRARLTQARTEKGLSASELAKKVGSSEASISNWETGRYVPSESNRLKLVKFLGLPETLGQAASLAISNGHA